MGKLLLAVGMDINARTGADAYFPGSTPLHLAARRSKFAMVDYLIEHGAAVTIEIDFARKPR
jgi:ankyrin repeat protein